jgi:hypothetical protein
MIFNLLSMVSKITRYIEICPDTCSGSLQDEFERLPGDAAHGLAVAAGRLTAPGFDGRERSLIEPFETAAGVDAGGGYAALFVEFDM